jgi:hypothetical protein
MSCGCYPHGPEEPCTCDGRTSSGTDCYCKGRVVGCTCDINWDCTSYDPCRERAKEREC